MAYVLQRWVAKPAPFLCMHAGIQISAHIIACLLFLRVKTQAGSVSFACSAEHVPSAYYVMHIFH